MLAERNHGVGKTGDVAQQVDTEAGERDLGRGYDEHHTQQEKVYQVDDNERKNRAVIAQVALIFRNHPAGESEVKSPRHPNERVEESPVRLQVHEETASSVE